MSQLKPIQYARTLWDWLTAPAPSVQLDEHRRRARLLSALHLALITVSILLVIFLPPAPGAPMLYTLGTLLFMVFNYGLSRTRWHRLTAGLLVGSFSLFFYVLAIHMAISGRADYAAPLMWLAIPIVIAYLLLPFRLTALLASAQLLALLALKFILPETPQVNLNFLFAFHLMLDALVLIAAAIRQRHAGQMTRQARDLVESEERFRRLVEFSPEMIAVYSDGVLVYINAAGAHLLGASRPEMVVGRPILDFVHSQQHDMVSAQLMRLPNQSEFAIRSTQKFVRLNGQNLDVDVTATPVTYQGRLATQIIVRDITRQKQSELLLRESEAKFRALAENLPVPMFIYQDRGLRYVNPAMEALTGYPCEALTVPNPALFAGRDFQQEIEARQNGEPIPAPGTFSITTRSGEERWVSYTGQLIDFEGKPALLGTLMDITEQKQAQDALRKSESRYRNLVYQASDGIVLTDYHANYLEANAAMCDMLGYTREEFLKLNARDIIAPENLAAYPIRFEDALVGKTLHQERLLVRKDGSIITAEVTSRALDDGTFQAIMRDITERKQIEAAEREQRILAEALRDTAAALNSTLNLDEVLDRILTYITRIAPDDSVSIMLFENDIAHYVRHKGYIERGQNSFPAELHFSVNSVPSFRQMIETREPVLVTDTQKDPNWVSFPETAWVRSHVSAPIIVENVVSGFINVDSAQPGTFTAAHAERLQAFAHQASIALQNARRAARLEQLVAERTAELELERRQLQTILDATGEGMFYVEDGIIQLTNRMLGVITGYETSELTGQPVEILSGDLTESNAGQSMRAALRQILNGKIWRDEVKLRRRDGSLIDVALTVSPVGKPDDAPARAVTLVRDISDAKQLEAQKARFIAHAAHELRTPITNLNTRLYLLQRQPERQTEHLALLEQVVSRMSRLVEDLLDISRFEQGGIALRRENVILQKIVTDVAVLQEAEAERKAITLHTDLPLAPLAVFADPERLRQVFTNLITNAIHYTPEGGQITIHLWRKDCCAIIAVQDSGIGIAPGDLEHIFQPFYRASNAVRGTGLGLTICREIVELHEGRISVESEIGKGSRFIIELPVLV